MVDLSKVGKNYVYAPLPDVEVEVGDVVDVSKFQPQVKFKRWGNDANCSFRIQLPGGQKETVTEDGTKIVWSKGAYSAVWYDRPDASEDGGFEFEIHLGKKPPTNSLTFSIQSKNVTFGYQGELTPEDIAAGAYRPQNVVGSYTVYHSTKRDNEYKCGKLCHIYRPHAVDSAGNEVWGDVSIDPVAGTMTISLPQAWLNSAVYPVTVDPTFGYTSVGASQIDCGNSYATRVNKFTASAGNLVDIRTRVVSVNGGSCNVVLGAYNDSSNAPGSRINYGSTTATGNSWNVVTLNGTLTAGSKWLAVTTDQPTVTISVAYDDPPSTQFVSLWAGTIADPFGTPDGNYVGPTVSIYATQSVTNSGAGSISAAATVSGVGAKYATTPASITASTVVSGVATKVLPTIGSIAAAGVVSGVGESTGGGTVVSGAGSISSSASVSGVGSSIAHTTATVALAATVDSSGAGILPTAGTTVSAGTLTGAGSSIAHATGSVTSSATCTSSGGGILEAVGSLVVAVVLAATGVWTAATAGAITSTTLVFATLAPVYAATASVTAGVVVSGVGASTAESVGAVVAAATVISSGAGIVPASGSSAATASVAGVGACTSLGTAAITSGVVTTLVGESTATAVGSISATCNATFFTDSATVNSGSGLVESVGVVTGAGAGIGPTVATIASVGTVESVGAAVIPSVGTITSTASTAVVGVSTAETVGSITSTCSATFLSISATVVSGSGSIVGTGSVVGAGGGILPAVGTVDASGVVTADGACTALATAVCTANVVVDGAGASTAETFTTIESIASLYAYSDRLGAGSSIITSTMEMVGVGESTAIGVATSTSTGQLVATGVAIGQGDGSIVVTCTVLGEGSSPATFEGAGICLATSGVAAVAAKILPCSGTILPTLSTFWYSTSLFSPLGVLNSYLALTVPKDHTVLLCTPVANTISLQRPIQFTLTPLP